MKSIHEFLAEAKAPAKKKEAPKKDTVSSSRIKCMQTVIEHLKKALGDYDISTRKFVWDKLTSKKGEELVQQIVKYPKTSMSMSEFNKLVIDTKK